MRHFQGRWSVVATLALVILLASGSALAGKTTFVSTDFNTKNLDRSLWTLVNPRNDGGIAMIETGTSNASVAITVPGGIEHNLWTDGDNLVRIMQNSTNTDFNLEVKFLSGLVGGTAESYTAQGVIIEQDANNKLEFCFTTGTTDSARAYAATFIGGLGSPSVKVNKKMAALGEAPLWLRVLRSGNTWRFAYSLNGSAWDTAVTFTQSLTVTKVGPFSLNAGSKPKEFAAIVDYFHNLDSIKAADDSQPVPNDTVPPFLHSVRILNLAANAMQIAFNSDERTTARIEYGTTAGYGSNLYDVDYAYSHYMTLTNLNPTTNYNYRVSVGDTNEIVSQTGNLTQTTPAIVNDVSSRSDEFADTVLNAALWSIKDPRGDAVVSVTSDQLSIAVPSATTHDLWTGGDYLTRVEQSIAAANNREFIVKFNTGVNGTSSIYRFQGMVMEETPTRLMRFDFLNDGSNTRLFCASFPFGVEAPVVRFNVSLGPLQIAPLYMRVRQYGALWTVDYSFDGSAWTQAGSYWDFIAPLKVAISTGNEGSPIPSNLSLTEYFQGALPAATIPTSPANGSTGLSLPVTVTWRNAVGATGYHVQVARDSNFTVLVLNDSSLTQPTRTVTGLQNDLKYFWRVKSKNAKGSSAYSAVWNFRTIPGIPGAPSLVSPADGATNQPQSSTLRWNAVPNATSYYVQCGTDSTFATALVVDDSTVTDTLRAVTGLAQNTKYFWRVRSKSIGGVGPFSAVWNFTTVVPLPSQVVLLSPGNNTVVANDTVIFVWNSAQPAVTRYWVEWAPDSLFAFGLVDSMVTDTQKVVGQIISNLRYFWKVRAKNATGWGPFSEVRRFNALFVSVGEERGLPTEYVLAQNFPNPFNPATRIEFGMPQAGHVTLEVYNMLGELVATLVDAEKTAGYHQVAFDGTRFASGIYFYRLIANDLVLMKKMVYLK